MKTKTTKNTKAPKTTPFEDLRENFLMDAELNEKQMDEIDAIIDGDFDALNSFIARYNKLKAIEMPQKVKALKLDLTDFSAVSLGDVVKFHYTAKAIKSMNKYNIVCDIAFTDDKAITPDKMAEYDSAVVTAIDGGRITAISKNSGVEYTLLDEDFTGNINGQVVKTAKSCLFGILPFRLYKVAADEKN